MAMQRTDLKLLINNYQEWANRLFPRLAFDDFVERAEKLGAKKEVKVSYLWTACSVHQVYAVLLLYIIGCCESVEKWHHYSG